MILACPLCHTRYLLSASVFALGPRQVRCARCSHSWEADLPKEMDAVGFPPALDLSPPPEEVTPIPPGSNVPAIREKLSPRARLVLQITVALIIVFLLASLVLFRQAIAGKWPDTERYYNSIGLHIYHNGEGLSLDKVRSELRYDGGVMELAIEGSVHNGTTNMQKIPDIKASAVGADGSTIQSWQIDAPALTVQPDEDIPFRSVINAPKGTVAEINLDFIEIKHDHDQ